MNDDGYEQEVNTTAIHYTFIIYVNYELYDMNMNHVQLTIIYHATCIQQPESTQTTNYDHCPAVCPIIGCCFVETASSFTAP